MLTLPFWCDHERIGRCPPRIIADPASLESNSQILGRTSPRLLDLVAALAPGTAGAFAMCRRDPGSSRTANRRRAYIVVSILTIVVVLPLIANTMYTVLHARWSAEIGAAAEDWLADEDRALVEDVT